MILGYTLQWINITFGGLVVFALLAFQMLVGMRKIKFKGRTHMKVHRYGAWVLVVLAAGHGFLALTLLNGWKILS